VRGLYQRIPIIYFFGLHFLLLAPGDVLLAADDVSKPLRVAVHVHSTISTGVQTPEQAMESFRQAGADAVIFTDSLSRRWEFGIWPLANLIKRVVEQASVLRYGARRYVDEIGALNQPQAPVAAIAGIEAAPFYYWARTPFDSRGGQIRCWQQHLLALGLDARQLQALPIRRYDPYHGDQGAKPYQAFIDAVVDAGGLVFWAHPMSGHLGKHGRIEDYSEPYPHLLQTTSGYHGFALTYLGYLSLADPGGAWDRLLDEYARGARKQPPWIFGELDWRGTKRAANAVWTEVEARSRDPKDILEAMRLGRMWAVFRNGAEPPQLLEFSLADVASSRTATVGETLQASGGIRIHLSVLRQTVPAGLTRVTLIRNGQVLEVREAPNIRIDWDRFDAPEAGINVYRAIIEAPGGLVYTNPIFVENRDRY
jgi:hypothetical protein